jgi:hypothetical protein
LSTTLSALCRRLTWNHMSLYGVGKYE